MSQNDRYPTIPYPHRVVDSGLIATGSELRELVAELTSRASRQIVKGEFVVEEPQQLPLARLIVAIILSQRMALDLRLASNRESSEWMSHEWPRIVSTLCRPRNAEPMVTVQTSGTVGDPKFVTFPQRRLFSNGTRSCRGMPIGNYGLGYSLGTYGGLVAVAQVLQRGVHTLERVRPEDLVHPGRWPLAVVGATPSFWRSVIRLASRPARAVKCATLGGEPVEATLIEALKGRFPDAHVRQIYGTTEHGTLAVVDDELPGLPESILEDGPDHKKLKLVQGVLWARGAGGAWESTGDLVRLTNGRALFVGRVGSAINVGGMKISPREVETVALGVPGVYDVRAYPSPSTVMGEVVSLDVVCDSCRTSQIRRAIRAQVESTLGRHARPQRIRIVEHVKLTVAGKVDNVAK